MKDIKFITRKGLKSAKKVARHKIEGFLELVFFKEEVLKKYESNKDFSIGDEGTVMFGHEWGTFRGVFRVAKGIIGAHLGDIGEGFPYVELKHWKQYNVDPSIIPKKERYFDFRDTIRRMMHFMKLSNKRIESHITKFFFDIKLNDKRMFKLDKTKNLLDHIKRVINKNTVLEEFQSRVIFLNILLLEMINTDLIQTIFKRIDEDLCYSDNNLGIKEIYNSYLKGDVPEQLKSRLKTVIHPLQTLELLRKFILFLIVHHDVIILLRIKSLRGLKCNKDKIYKKIKKNFSDYYKYNVYNIDFDNKEYFENNNKKIKTDTEFLKLLNKFRNKTSAHGFSQGEYEKILNKLNLNVSEDDYSKVFETLITKVSYDIEHIYFNLISPDPPIKDYYLKYLRDSLIELHSGNTSYQSVFEELISYLHDFPEFYSKIIKGVKEEYSKKKQDSKFIVELGYFIESLSYVVKDKTQKLIDYLIPGLKYEKALTIAHFAHIIKNSDKISSSFLKKALPIVFEGVKDKKTINVNFSSEHVIFCLIKKCPEKLNKKKIIDLFKGEKINFSEVRNYITKD